MRRGEFSLNALPAWCALNDVSFIDVKVEDVEGRGYGLVADRDLINDEDNVEVPTLLTVPKDLVLSAEAVEEYAKVDKNFRELYEAAGHQSHRGNILLFLLVQLVLSSPDHTGPAAVHSPWTQYFSLLPAQVPIPTMWTETELSQLRGTSLESAVSAKLSALTKEFNDIRAKCKDVPFWCDILCEDELVTIHDWVLLDALYRSRTLGLPKSGESMVPCLDLVNHSREPTAYFDEDKKDEVVLLLRPGCSVSAGREITIDYGQGKAAAEMLFSYGFIDPGTPAKKIVLPLETMDGDPLAKAKLHVFGGMPTLEIEDAEDEAPKWRAPFAYLMCLNQEDGIEFGLLQENDGSRHLRLYWQQEDVTDKSETFESLIDGHDLCAVFKLRVVTVLLEQVQQQIETLRAHNDSNSNRILGVARAEILQTALRLRHVELDLLERTSKALEDQRDKLLEDDAVVAYLGSMEEPQNENVDQASNGEEDFS